MTRSSKAKSVAVQFVLLAASLAAGLLLVSIPFVIALLFFLYL